MKCLDVIAMLHGLVVVLLSVCAVSATSADIPTANSEQALRPFLVVDVSAGPTAPSYSASWLDEEPEGGWPDEYKTSKIVLRLVVPGSYERNYAIFKGGVRSVTLTHPFYLGVFEVTQRQWELVMGSWPFAFTNGLFASTRPADTIGYTDIRGRHLGLAWPYSRIVDSESFLGRLRARTGMSGFDLPTDAQWEYTCRAGGADPCTNIVAVARHRLSGVAVSPMPYKGNPSAAGLDEGTAPVGSYLPNAWGFYDMLGNVGEWVRDHYNSLYEVPVGDLVDPAGPVFDSDTRCVFRGGDYHSKSWACGPNAAWAHGIGDEHGFRLCCELPPVVFTNGPALADKFTK